MKRWLCLAALCGIVFSSTEDSIACSSSRGIWFHFHDQPGVERTDFLAGELGVLESSFDSTYLFVAYRTLAGHSLSERSRGAVATLFEPADLAAGTASREWTTHVSAVRQEQVSRNGTTEHLYYVNCNPDAFSTAAKTFEDRTARYGADSDALVRWQTAQDQVFQNCARGRVIPAAPDPAWSALERADRAYQIAAAHFYSRSFREAAERFQRIAEDPLSPWSDLASYLVARVWVREALVGEGERAQHLEQAARQLEAVLADPRRAAVHEPAANYIDYIHTLRMPREKLIELEARLLGELDESFPQTWRDYRWLSRRVPGDAPDMKAWFGALRSQSADVLADAHRRWQETGGLHWLALLLMKATPESAWVDEVLSAAAVIDPDSPAFWTASYYRIRLLLDSDRLDTAREALAGLPSRAPSLSDHNRFEGLRARVATDPATFLAHGAMVPVRAGFTDGVAIFSYPSDGLDTLRDGRRFFETETLETMNAHFSAEILTAQAENPDLPDHLRRTLALTAFSRAFLQRQASVAEDAARLASALAPDLAPALEDFLSATSDPERDFAGAFLLLRHPGLAPHLRGAATRIAPLDRLGDFRNANWWCVYPENVGARPTFLDERAEQVAASLAALDPAPIELGTKVLSWSDSHRDDPRVPEALHLVVRATRYGCEWGRQGEQLDYGDVSKRAFIALHRRYPDSPWTERTPYWYR